MTPRIGPLPYRKVRRLLHRYGFVETRQRGSHVEFRHADGRRVTVPRHDGVDIKVSLLRHLIDQAGIDPDALRR